MKKKPLTPEKLEANMAIYDRLLAYVFSEADLPPTQVFTQTEYGGANATQTPNNH